MTSNKAEKATWILGVLLPWFAVWLLLGIRTWASIQAEPHPFLKGVQLSGILLAAVIVWAGSALLAYLVVGLIASLIALAVLGTQAFRPSPFRKGLLMGFATLLWLHGVLYAQVPGALGSLPLFGKLPMAMALSLFLIPGVILTLLLLRGGGVARALLRGALALIILAGSLFVPHDVFRRWAPHPTPLGDSERRLALVSIDGLRRDTFESCMPQWKAPSDCQPVCAFPATRLAWNALFGAPIEEMRYAKLIPYQGELNAPDRLALLREAERRGIRTAFLIDDSLTPSYSLVPSLFTTVLEPEGGWRYWFTLGFGTSWPLFSWAQNVVSPIETSNPWCDTRAFYRDVGRQLRFHHWVSSHNCELHAPIVLRLGDLRGLSGWKWLGRSAYSYQPYTGWDQISKDQGVRLGPRASAQRHYSVRAARLLSEMSPFLQDWQQTYPRLSGVVTSDHGETFPGIYTQDRQLASTFSGIHGFRLDADTIQVPLHVFGQTTHHLKHGALFSWLDLRDCISAWLESQEPLSLSTNITSRIIQITAIQPAHLEGGEGSVRQPRAGGLEIRELMRTIVLRPNGLWYCGDLDEVSKSHSIFSTALAQGRRLVLYNPEKDGTFYREDWDGDRCLGTRSYDARQVELDIQSFKSTHQIPAIPKD
jgi:hypothetical protein